MDWYWCGCDADCWASWFWSPATAAWVQAIAAGALIAVTVWLWRRDRHRAEQAEMDRLHQNLVLIKGTFYRCHLTLGRIAPKFAIPSFKVAQRTILEGQRDLQDALKAGMPNAKIMGYVQGRITRMTEMDEWISQAPGAISLSMQSEDADERAKLKLTLDRELLKFAGEMEEAHDKVHEFQQRFAHDRWATWKVENGEGS